MKFTAFVESNIHANWVPSYRYCHRYAWGGSQKSKISSMPNPYVSGHRKQRIRAFHTSHSYWSIIYEELPVLRLSAVMYKQ